MPSLGADMEAGTLTDWLVNPGDAFERGDIVATVETAKGIIDIEIFEPGVVERLLVEPGAEVPVGTVLAIYRKAGEAAAIAGGAAAGPGRAAAAAPTSAATAPTSAAARPAAGGPGASAPPARSGAQPPAAPGRRPVSPAARRRARELGVDAESLAGSGAGGAVTLEDVERARGSTGAAAAGAKRTAAPPRPAGPQDMRAVIAQSMSRSKREIPHYYLATTVDMTAALGWLEKWNVAHPVTERLLYAVLLVKAVALALEAVPELNGYWRDGRFEPAAAANIGVAVRLRGGGLVAPALEDAARVPLPDLMRRFQDLVQRVRAGRLTRTELTAATITVSSLGEGSVETVFPIIYPPQVAIVGFGAIVQRPWCADGKVVPAPVITATLSADHRASDGHRGSLFLADLARRLLEPEGLL